MAEPDDGRVEYYAANYDHYATDLYAAIRSEIYGDTVHGNGWMTSDEQDLFISWLGLDAGSRLLDVACGSGDPALRFAGETGCRVVGVDVHENAVANAGRRAGQKGLSARAQFVAADASRPLPLPDASFTAITCIDAINHLPDRAAVLADWLRLLEPGGRLLFTDPIVVTGALSSEEIRIRSSIGFFLFVPPEEDARLLGSAGFRILKREDVTSNTALIARRWLEARARREEPLRAIEGDETYEGQQRFFEVAARVSAQRRLSRFAYLAEKPDGGTE